MLKISKLAILAVASMSACIGLSSHSNAKDQSTCIINQDGDGNSANCTIQDVTVNEDALAERIAEKIMRKKRSSNRSISRSNTPTLGRSDFATICYGPMHWRYLMPYEAIVGQFCAVSPYELGKADY